MQRSRFLLAASAAMVLLGGAAAGGEAAPHVPASQYRHHRSGRRVGNLTLHARLRRPGVYRVRVLITSRSGRRAAVRLEVGHVRYRATLTAGRRSKVVHLNVLVRGRVLALRSVPLLGRARVRVALKRVGAVPDSKPKAKTKGSSGSKGSTGTTGSTAGSTGSTGSTSGSTPPAGSASGSGSGPASSGPTGVGGSWNLIFDDEFNAPSLNTRSWSTGWFGSGITGGVSSSEPECYDPNKVVQTGELDLNFTQGAENCDGSSHPYTSGMVTTNPSTTNPGFQFSYGFIEARVWLPTTGGGQVADWPAVWTDGQSWPNDGEIDIVEGLGGAACAHWHGPTGNGYGYGAGGGTGCPSGTWTGGWHTFAADWEPGIVTWYYDGHDIGCVASSGSACGSSNSQITSSPMYVIMSVGSDSSYTITSPTSMRVAYVRVWQH